MHTTKTQTKEQCIKDLSNKTIRVFHHQDFDKISKRKEILSEMPDLEKFNIEKDKLVDQFNAEKRPAEFRPFYELPLLNFAQEQHLFRKMNYFNYFAKKWIDSLTIKSSDQRIAHIKKYLFLANNLKNQIASSNFRLSGMILKCNVSVYRDNGLMEDLLSESYDNILKSVDYFDWTRGLRFSTYATWVLKKNFFKNSQNASKYFSQNVFFVDVNFEEKSIDMNYDPSEKLDFSENHQHNKRIVENLFDALKDAPGTTETNRKRQIDILKKCYGFYGEKQTLESIGKEVGLTKERVRQIKSQGINWFKKQVSKLGIEYDV